MDQESLVLKTRENPDQTLLWEAASALLRLGWEWMVLGVMCHCFSWVLRHWKRRSWGHWSWWGDSAVPQGGICGSRSLQPFWCLACLVNAVGAQGQELDHQRLPGHTDPGDPQVCLFPWSVRHNTLLSSCPTISLASSHSPDLPSLLDCSVCGVPQGSIAVIVVFLIILWVL